LTYDKSTFEIRNFLTIPKYFFVPAIIEKRKALSPTARRAGWVGCNIDVSNIPELGKIYFVQNGVVKSKDEVLENWSKTDFVKATQNIESKGWLLDVLKANHPSNNNVKAKIRQQLQFLRDKEVLDFVGRGQYRIVGR
jgi:type II restriction enzyme